MPRDLTPTSGLSATSNIDTSIEVPDADDTSSAARQQAAIQALLDNDAIIIAKIAPNTLAATLGQTLTGWINQGAIADGAINAAKLSAASGATGTVLQRQGSGTNIIWVAPISITTGTGLDGADSGVDVIGGSDVTLSIAAGGVDTTQIAADAVDASKLDTATAGTVGQALLKGSGNQMTWGSAGGSEITWTAGTPTNLSNITSSSINFQSLVAFKIDAIVFYSGRVIITPSSTNPFQFSFNAPSGSPTDNQYGVAGIHLANEADLRIRTVGGKLEILGSGFNVSRNANFTGFYVL